MNKYKKSTIAALAIFMLISTTACNSTEENSSSELRESPPDTIATTAETETEPESESETTTKVTETSSSSVEESDNTALTKVEFNELEDDEYTKKDDTLSGNIKDMYVAGYNYIILDNQGNVYNCDLNSSGRGYEISKIAEKTKLTNLNNMYFSQSDNIQTFIALDGNTMYYKALNNDGTPKQDANENIPMDFTSTVLDGKTIKSFAVDNYHVKMVDENNKFYCGEFWHYAWEKDSDPYNGDNKFFDSEKVLSDGTDWYYDVDNDKYLKDTITQVANNYLLTKTGNIRYDRPGYSSTFGIRIEKLNNVKFSKLFKPDIYWYNDSLNYLKEAICALGTDGKIYIIAGREEENPVIAKIEKPEGNVEEIHLDEHNLIVKTDKGYFKATIGDATTISDFKINSELTPCDVLNDNADKIVKLYADKVLCTDGAIYQVNELKSDN